MPKLTWIGHAAFMLEEGDNTVLVDPFITGNPVAKHTADQLSPRTILLTHAHDDHVGDTVAIAKRTGAKVISTLELAVWLKEDRGVEGATPANHGGTVAFEGGTVKLTPAWHTSSYRVGDTFVAPGMPAGLVVRFGGKTIYFAGDTCLFGDMKLIGEEGLDVAVIPIGDHYTMGPADAVRAAEFLNAKTVLPCHYNTFDLIAQDGHEFKRTVEARTSSKVALLAPGESLTL
ncbi:MAG: metal-dependent hydrolase [Chloroflexota bacterium]|nr:metal-dependent hydrolase [Chloroflexota bacterium]